LEAFQVKNHSFMNNQHQDKVVSFKKEQGNIESSFEYFKKFKLNKNVRVLEIGCHYGSLLFNIYKLGYSNIFGLDIKKTCIAQGQEKYQVIANRLLHYSGKKLPFQDSYFDIVLMFDVIEHIPNIQDFLTNQAGRVLKRDGGFDFSNSQQIY